MAAESELTPVIDHKGTRAMSTAHASLPQPRPREKRAEKALLAFQKAERHEQRAREAGERNDFCAAAL